MIDSERLAAMWPMVERALEEEYRQRVDHALAEGLFADCPTWQLGELFGHSLPLAMFHVARLPDYPAFRARWLDLFGEDVWRWLPSLFAAAAASPAIAAEARKSLLLSLTRAADLSQ